jgi:acetyl esterase
MAVDEATAAVLAGLASLGRKPLHESTPHEAREFSAMQRQLSGPGPDMELAYDEALPTADGGFFGVRVLVPSGQVRALIVYYHGGGWVLGSAEDFDALGRTIAEELSSVVVLVDYRLAPEHRFPAAADDAWQALQWAAGQSAVITGGTVPLVVMGDSAGGNLAAVVARKAREAGGPAIAAQVLVYPVTDADLDNATYLDPENQLMLTRDSMVWFWDHYAPEPADRLSPDASPLRVTDLSGLPAAIVLTAEHDVLRQEGEEYAERLRRAGVPVQLRRCAGQMHGFFPMLNILPGSADGISYIAEQLGPMLG